MQTIRIIVEGGVIQNVLDVPEGVEVEVRDYDVDGGEQDLELEEDDRGDHYVKSVYAGREPKAVPFPALLTDDQRADVLDALHTYAPDSEEQQGRIMSLIEWLEAVDDAVNSRAK